MTKIIICDCDNSTMDKFHGKNKRVANSTVKKGDKVQWRCTSCLKLT